MKNLSTWRASIFSILCIMLLSSTLQAKDFDLEQEFDRVIEKEFPISADGTLDLANKYGAINITEWNKNAVSIKVIIEVKASSEGKADDIFDRIKINFSDNANAVGAETEIESKSTSWFSWGSSSNDFRINYEVKMPKSVHLNLSNKYGNTNIPNLTNGADLVVKYGNVRINELSGKLDLKLGYGNAEFNTIEDGKMDISYSNVNGESAGDLNIQSKYSQVDIGIAGNVRSDSKYDDYHFEKLNSISNIGKYDDFSIDEANSIDFETKFADLKIGTVKGDVTIQQDYGNLEISNLECSKSDLRLDLGYTDVNLDLNGCNDYDLSYNGKYVDLTVTSEIDDHIQSEGTNEKSIRSKEGNGSRKMDINMKYGKLKIK